MFILIKMLQTSCALQGDSENLAMSMPTICAVPVLWGHPWDIALYQTPQQVISFHSDTAASCNSLTRPFSFVFNKWFLLSCHACLKIHFKLKARNCMSNTRPSQRQGEKDWSGYLAKDTTKKDSWVQDAQHQLASPIQLFQGTE